jgi:hypothetical protein
MDALSCGDSEGCYGTAAEVSGAHAEPDTNSAP